MSHRCIVPRSPTPYEVAIKALEQELVRLHATYNRFNTRPQEEDAKLLEQISFIHKALVDAINQPENKDVSSQKFDPVDSGHAC